ncbi:hypothetical protein LUZ60_001427 [Juncus effusus]|nr:hypothetical protein LUZ60_001427 [Juncus effusus]
MRCELLCFKIYLLQLLLILPIHVADNTSTSTGLSPTQSLSDGQTLISLNKTFELGFFSPNGSANRYVGIWYHQIPLKRVVWIANRNNPLMASSGTIFFNNNGDFIIVDSRGSPFTVVSGYGSKTTEAILLDSGNLILRNINNASSIVWQSFDYPTDTWLPGMRLGMKDRQNQLITTWRSSSDPSTGDFSFGMDPNGTEQFVIWEKQNIYWASVGIPNDIPFARINVVSNSGAYYTEASNYGIPTMFSINNMGHIQLLSWMDTVQEWSLVWNAPDKTCDVYNICGANGLCNDGYTYPPCGCMKGFVPASQIDWNNGTGDTSAGCVRETKLPCETSLENVTFFVVKLVSLPLYSKALNIGRIEECESVCSGQCNCTAYAFSQACNIWYGDLLNLTEFNSIISSSENGFNLYVRTALSSLDGSRGAGNKRKKYIIIGIAIATFLAFLILCIVLFSLLCKKQSQRVTKKLQDKQLMLNLGTGEESTLWESDEKASNVSLFDFSQIAEATSYFAADNKLGQGGFGPVYRGCLQQGQEIAVKRLASNSGQGLVEFKNEIVLIAKLQHRNLVRLLGCCIKGEEKMLIYEYMPNKSLDFFIFDETRGALLDWDKRFHIIEGIAQGLLYLHKHSRLKIIHRDLKPSNILLDEEMNPKISDFGLARIFGSNETQANTRRVVGTYGYMSPEYAMEEVAGWRCIALPR